MNSWTSGLLLSALACVACAASTEQVPATTSEAPAGRSCADLDERAHQAAEAGHRGEWGSAARLSVDADMLADSCTEEAARARYQQARRQLWDELEAWRTSQSDLVARVRADSEYVAALAHQARIGDRREGSTPAATPSSEAPGGGSGMRGGGGRHGGGGGGRGGEPSADAQFRAEERAAQAEMVAVLRRFGLRPEEARLLRLLH
jgi:hypothetical protein